MTIDELRNKIADIKKWKREHPLTESLECASLPRLEKQLQEMELKKVMKEQTLEHLRDYLKQVVKIRGRNSEKARMIAVNIEIIERSL